MSDASHQPPDKPRTWIPLAGAAVAAALVLGIALSTFVFGDDLTDTEKAMIETCEAEYVRTNGVPILGGNIYVPPEMRDYYAVAETHGEVPVPLDEVPAEVTDQWEDAAAHYVDTGAGTVVLVWRHEDDSYTQCAVDFTATGVDANSARLGPLEVAAVG